MRRNKRRILVVALAASIMISSSYASSLEFSLSPAVPAGSYITDGGDVTYVDISKHVSPGFIVSAGGFADIYPWLSVGGVSYIDTRSLLDNPGAFLTVPVMAALRFSYPSERFDIPLTLMAGFHAQTAGEDVRLGPAFAASLGLGLQVAEGLYLDVSAWLSLLMQLGTGGRVSYQLVVRPVAIGLRAMF